MALARWCGNKIKGYTKYRRWRLCASCFLDSSNNKKTLTLKGKSEWLPSRFFSQAMSVLSFGEDKGLEPFIEKLTEAQKADINKKFEIYHRTGRLKGGAAKAVRVQFAKLMNYLLYAWAPIARQCHSLRYFQWFISPAGRLYT